MQQDDGYDTPKSARYWRLNSIAALRMMHIAESLAQDPEHLDAIKADKAELSRLVEIEEGVRNRYARISSRTHSKATPCPTATPKLTV